MSIGTAIDFFLIDGGGAEVEPKEYFLGFQETGTTLQDVLDRYSLTIPSGEVPVLSVAFPDDDGIGYVVRKYFVQLSSGETYNPLGDYATAKQLILIDTIYPDEQTTEAALTAVDAVVFPEFTLTALSDLLTYLNTSATPIDVSDEDKIYYFKFTAGADSYVYVLSPDAVRGIYGNGLLQFAEGDLIQFYSSARIDFSLLDKKLNVGENTHLESLADTTDVYGLGLIDRKGQVKRINTLTYNQLLGKLTIAGTQAIWEAFAGVTDGNMGIKALNNALEAFKLFDDSGNFISAGTESGKRMVRVLTALRKINGTGYNEAEFKTVDLQTTDASLVIKSFTVPNNSILTIDICNISAFTSDKKYLTGMAQFTLMNDAGTVTAVGTDDLRFGRQWSSLKSVPGYVTTADTRLDCTISGTTVNLVYVNADSKLTTAHCEVKHNFCLLPTI